MTTDEAGDYHGTHVAGTAAGGYTANGFQGMAPESEILMCGNGITDARMLRGIKNFVDYATNAGKPITVNVSIGSNSGPHDGSDAFCKGVGELVKEGVIVVVSSGNEGEIRMYLGKEFTAESNTVQTLVSDTNSGGDQYGCNLELYVTSGSLPSIKFFVADAETNEILCTTKDISFSSGITWQLLYESEYSTFSKYYTSDAETNAAFDINAFVSGGNGIIMSISGESVTEGKYYIGVAVTGNAGTVINFWTGADNLEFIDNGSDAFTAGDASKSMNSMVCTDNVISVGAYTGTNSYTSLDGNVHTFSQFNVNDIAPFSSYGIDMNGVSRPDICSPGVNILSSSNIYCTMIPDSMIVDQVQSGDNTYKWAIGTGTSMATPCVTGIIATWMQYKPTLSVAEVREILTETAIRDEYVTSGDPVKWGKGKIDAYAGLQYIMTSGVNDVEVSQNNVLIYPNPNGGQFKVLTQGETDGATLSVYNAAGALVYTSPINASDDAIEVDLSGNLNAGIYVVAITGEKVNYSTRMIIK